MEFFITKIMTIFIFSIFFSFSVSFVSSFLVSHTNSFEQELAKISGKQNSRIVFPENSEEFMEHYSPTPRFE